MLRLGSVALETRAASAVVAGAAAGAGAQESPLANPRRYAPARSAPPGFAAAPRPPPPTAQQRRHHRRDGRRGLRPAARQPSKGPSAQAEGAHGAARCAPQPFKKPHPGRFLGLIFPVESVQRHRRCCLGRRQQRR